MRVRNEGEKQGRCRRAGTQTIRPSRFKPGTIARPMAFLAEAGTAYVIAEAVFADKVG